MSLAGGPASARLFVALDLPEAVRDDLAAWGGRCAAGESELRAVGRDALHVTLCFLGSRRAAEVEAIGAAVVACTGPAPRLALAPAEWLPPRRPRVLAATVRDLDGTLERLQGRVATALAAGGWYVPDRRPFHPHVTVARVRRGGRRPRRPAAAPDAGAFAGAALTLYRSHAGAGPAFYEALSRVALAA